MHSIPAAARRTTYGLVAATLLLTVAACSDSSGQARVLASAPETTGSTGEAAPTTSAPAPSSPLARPSAKVTLPAARSTSVASDKSRRTDESRRPEKPPRTEKATRSKRPARTTTSSRSASADSPQLTRLERRAMDLINGHRRDHGCKALTIDGRLLTASREYAEKMVRTHHFSHESVDGDGPSERAQRSGFPGGAAENIMMGAPDDPEGLVNNPGWGWMQSEGHRNNILNCDSNVAGIGYDPGVIDPKFASGSWVLMLSRRD